MPREAQQIHTLVVHREQLTAENLSQLGAAGYSIISDPSLLIFGRPVPASDQGGAVVPEALANGQTDASLETLQVP